MRATSTLPAVDKSRNGSTSTATNGYLSIGGASRQFSISVSTLRRWVDSGKLRASVTPGGWRKIRSRDLESLLGLSGGGDAEQDGQVRGKYALLARVSGAKQGQGFDTTNGQRRENGQESDLERQVAQLQKYCQEKYGVDGILYSDIGSGLNFSRPHFVKLLEEICEGRWRNGTVIVTHKDRLCRWGGELVELLCRTHGVTLDIIDRQSAVSSEEELADDVLSVITVMSSRKHGRRSAENNTFTLSAEAVELAKQLKDSGYTNRHIIKVLRQEGHTMSNNRGIVRPVTRWVVRKIFDGNRVENLLEVALPTEENDGTSWDEWSAKHIKITGKATDKIMVKTIYDDYKTHCKRQDAIPCSIVVVGRWLKRHASRRYRVCGRIKLEGLKLV